MSFSPELIILFPSLSQVIIVFAGLSLSLFCCLIDQTIGTLLPPLSPLSLATAI